MLVGQVSPMRNSQYLEDDSWNSETDTLASKCFVDLFVRFFDAMRSQLENVVDIITSVLSSMLTQDGCFTPFGCFNATCFFEPHQDHAKC